MSTEETRRVPWRQDLLAALVTTLVVVGTLLARGGIWEHVGGQDLHAHFLPRYGEAARAIFSEGRLPLWNPWEFCGTPLFAQMQGLVLYVPVPLLFATLPPYVALQAFYALNVLVLAWGGVAYLRRHGVPRWGGGLATLIAVAGVFSTPSGVGIDHPNFLASVSWLPWILLCFENALVRGARPWLGLLGLSLCAQWLAGYPDIPMDTAVLLGVVALAAGGAPVWRRVAVAAGGLVLGAALAAVQLAPLAEAVAQSFRAVAVGEYEITRRFMAHGATGLWRGVLWGPLGPGPAGVLLGAIALRRPTRTRLAWLAAWLWCLFALDPPLDLLYRLPPFSNVRYPHGWDQLLPVFTGFFVAAAAAVLAAPARRVTRVVVAALLVVTVVHAERAVWHAPVRGRFTAPDYALLERRAAILRSFLAATEPAPRLVSQREMHAGMFLRGRLPSMAGYDPTMPPRHVRRLIDEINAGTRVRGRRIHVLHAPGLAASMGVGVVAAASSEASRYEAAGFRSAMPLPPDQRLFHRRPVPRARLVSRVVTGADDAAMLARLIDPERDAERTAVLVGAAASALAPIGPAAPHDGAWIVHDAPERVVVATQSQSPALLVLTDTHYPGWIARVDGEPAAIVRADYAFRGVRVESGTHRVEFRYAPVSLRLGGLVSTGGLVIVALLLAPRRYQLRPI